MEIINNGTICSNKDFKIGEMTGVIKAIFPEESVFINGTKEIVFDEHYENYLECGLRKMIQILSRRGHVFSGEIAYYGDYDGYYIVKNNNVTAYDTDDAWKHFASDDVIIEVLESRGYTVVKEEVLAS